MAQVRLICQSTAFARLEKRGKPLFLYLVSETLKHPTRSPRIKEITIAVEFYGIAASDFSKSDSKVKVAVGDLRERLDKYYQTEARNDPVLIEIGPGQYVPRFSLVVSFPPLEMDVRALHYLSVVRQGMDERHSGAELVPDIFVPDLDPKYLKHPRFVALQAMQQAVNATYDSFASPREALRQAESIIGKVREQGIEPWECTVTDAWIKAALYWDWEGADNLFQQAIAASPEAKTIHQWYPFFLASQLRLEEAEAVLQEAVSRTAYDRPVTRADLAFFQILLGKLDDAEETLRAALPLVKHMVNSADFPIGHGQAALLDAVRGDFESAISHLLCGETQMNPMFLGLLSLFSGALGAREVAVQGLEKLESGVFDRCSLPLAYAALGAGDEDLAVKCLIKGAKSDRDPWSLILTVHPLLRSLHRHAEFQSLITEAMKLPFPTKG
jgi:tetratricopeptide (TPR) repeat protein